MTGRSGPPAFAAATAPPLWRLLQAAAGIVEAVARGRAATAALDGVPRDLRAGTQALAFSALRRLGAARALRDGLVRRAAPPGVDALLCTALALLLPAEARPYPDFTLVDQAVEAAKRQTPTRRHAALLNACLRRFLRERDAMLTALQADSVAAWNHPQWWIDRLRHDHPDAWKEILRQDQEPAPMDLRVNLQRTSAADYVARLQQAGIPCEPLGAAAVRLAQSRPVHSLPGFADGMVSVQSATAQRAAPLLLQGLRPDGALRILDACAAPGGKTAHLLEIGPRLRVTALEIDAERSRRIRQNLDRLGLEAELRIADAGNPSGWWDGVPYDAILLDAPCSASGIVRRHPDIRWLRRSDDIARLAQAQDRLLDALWPLLAPGGYLLYCTCSVFKQEGSVRIDAFGARHADAQRLPAPGHLLPRTVDSTAAVGDNADRDGDGFFFAKLRKCAR